MTGFVEILTALIMIVGALFTLVAVIGILRFPDIYSRSHSASKAGTLGSGLLLLSIAVFAMDFGVATRALAGFIFLLLTAPISAHLLVRAAYFVGHRPWPGTRTDHLRNRYSRSGSTIRCGAYDHQNSGQ